MKTHFGFSWLSRLQLLVINKFSFPKISYRHIVGIAGPPGSGKSTLASEVARRVNKLWPLKASSLDSQVKAPDVATVLPMDGFHLYRSQLDAMEVDFLSLL
jgi:pantothenate kinase